MTQLPRDLLYSAYRFTGLHLAPDASSKTITGTCFYVRAGTETFVVTNKHNFSLAHANRKFVGYKLDGLCITGYFGIDQYAECDLAGQTIRFATPDNDAEDVVVMDVTGVSFHFIRLRLPGEDPSTKTSSLSPIAVDIGMLARKEDLEKLTPGSRVAFPGYPALFDANGHRPIMRTGTIASDPLSDYRAADHEPARRILYESHSTEGSSGGPVFCPISATEVIVIGINSGHLTTNEPKIGKIHSGLSYCFKSSCIQDAIEKLRSERNAD